MDKHCKICGHSLVVAHVIKDVTYYRCPDCGFLQNFHWEEHPQADKAQVEANAEARERLWLAGEDESMRQKGWEMMEFMAVPTSWFSRKLHHTLNALPAYRRWAQGRVTSQLKKLLDFGCGHGEVVMQLRKEKFDVLGLDPFSPNMDPAIIHEELIAHHFADNTFDGIFTIETMEHIPNVLEIFQELRRILKPGASLIVQTRRVEDPNYIANGANWFYLQEPTTHVSIYSEQAMQIIAKKTGWKSVSFRGVKFARFIK